MNEAASPSTAAPGAGGRPDDTARADERGPWRTVGLSAALHLAVIAVLFLFDWPSRPIEPEPALIPVELVLGTGRAGAAGGGTDTLAGGGPGGGAEGGPAGEAADIESGAPAAQPAAQATQTAADTTDPARPTVEAQPPAPQPRLPRPTGSAVGIPTE
ncbi:MAG: hypothetical protein ACK4QW_05020, partial [Alphaproteobacteria bacterium]